MKRLIIVRHGSYGDNGRLNDRGRSQIESLTKKIQAMVGSDSIVILSSTADRAQESAEILSQMSGEFENHTVLWSESSRPPENQVVLDLVKTKREADTVILVTHYEYVDTFPRFFGIRELNTDLNSRVIEKGEAWIVDCENKTLDLLQP